MLTTSASPETLQALWDQSVGCELALCDFFMRTKVLVDLHVKEGHGPPWKVGERVQLEGVYPVLNSWHFTWVQVRWTTQHRSHWVFRRMKVYKDDQINFFIILNIVKGA